MKNYLITNYHLYDSKQVHIDFLTDDEIRWSFNNNGKREQYAHKDTPQLRMESLDFEGHFGFKVVSDKPVDKM